MRVGSDRVDVPYAWPRTLRLPGRPPTVVYLDLNHWIGLSKAKTGRKDGSQFATTLDECSRAVRDGRAVFPISATMVVEIDKITSHRQRKDLRAVIESVSRYVVVTSRPIVATHEIEDLLDRLVGPSSDPVNEMDVLDWGVARAFGTSGELEIMRDGVVVTEQARKEFPQGPEAFDRMVASAHVGLQRSVLDGPSPEEEPELRALGWNPEATLDSYERRATAELEQAARFDKDPNWRRGRVRDAIVARELSFDLHEILSKALSDRDVALTDVFPGPDTARPAFDALPSFDTSVTLKTDLHRNGHHQWTRNDIYDIDALAVAVPYVDVVVTDKAMAHRCNATGLADRLQTSIISELNELPRLL